MGSGWRVRISVEGTALESCPFVGVDVERTPLDWYRTWVAGDVFQAACGPTNLTEVLEAFRAWAEVSGADIEA